MMLARLLKDLLRRRKPLSSGDMVAQVRALLEQARFDDAARIATDFIAREPDSAELLRLRGVAALNAGRPLEACPDLARAAELAPGQPNYLLDAALAWRALGDNGKAIEYCERARRADPDFGPAYHLQARIVLGGEPYTAVLARIHELLHPRSYVEIGVFDGRSLQIATPPTIAIGIDPEPKLARAPAPNHRVFAETSDAFFSGRDLRDELGGLPVDLAFIDGMHHFEYALRDFINLERYCTRGSVIMIHDCYPLDRETAERVPRGDFWSGDIWRLVVLLKKYRPDLAIDTVGTPPTGLAIVRNLDPGSRFLPERVGPLCDEFLALDYAYLDDDKAGKLNLFPNDWHKIKALLV